MEATIALFTLSIIVAIIQTNLSSQLSIDFGDWFRQLDDDLRNIYHTAATFAWNLSIEVDEQTENDYKIFTVNKSIWNNRKCEEINEFAALAELNSTAANLTILKACAKLLCTGLSYTKQDAEQLTFYLRAMQTISVNTQICLPKHFDVCRNWDHIWNFTYVLRDGNVLEQLDLSAVTPKFEATSVLRLIDGGVFGEYRGDNYEENPLKWYKNIEQLLRLDEMKCLGGEEELSNMLMGHFSVFGRSDCRPQATNLYRWGWESWRLAVGNEIAQIYPNAVDIMNIAAQNNGFQDVGEVWRQEIDLPHLEDTLSDLMQQIRPFYQLLHAVVRNVIGENVRKSFQTISAHLLGMWSQDWQMYQSLVLPFDEFSLDVAMAELNWTSANMVEHADDFYRSLSLPPMSTEFWSNSILMKNQSFRNCHGTAANMFNGDDYRMIVCAKPTIHDLSVIVHEMGHLHYFMAFKDQPVIYQDGNAALQESIGDAIFLGMMTPHHLNRLNILPDKYLMTTTPTKLSISHMKLLYSLNNLISVDDQPTIVKSPRTTNTKSTKNAYNANTQHAINDLDLVLLLRMALSKIPSIPFQYIMDAVRWNLFNGTVGMHDANTFYWKLAVREQGIHPPDWIDRRNYFDIGAKFHTADNTPFMRYFLASFIQAQIFEGLCKVTVFGTVDTKQRLPMPLHRCDIYGSKNAGKLLQKALRLGTSQHWTEVLYLLSGRRTISADALLNYYKPLVEWLEHLVKKLDMPVGW